MSEGKPISAPAVDAIARRGAAHRKSWLESHINDFAVGLISHGYAITMTNTSTGCRIDLREGAALMPAATTPNCPIVRFLSTWCVVTGDARDVVSSRELHAALDFYLARTGAKPMTAQARTRQFAKVVSGYVDPRTGKTAARFKSSRVHFAGIRLVAEMPKASDVSETRALVQSVLAGGCP